MDCCYLMRRAAAYNADRTAIAHGTRALTFAEAWQRGCRLANALSSLGIQSGDRVAVLEDNSIEAADFFLGCTIANAVRVPLYPRNSAAAHLHMMGHTRCKALFVSARYAEEAANLVGQLPDLQHVVVRDADYESWLAGFPDTDPHVAIDPDDPTIIRHTGGTSGLPKGVAYSHRALLAAGRDWFLTFPPMNPGEQCLHVGPISHGSGYLFLPTWLNGGCNVLLDQFDTRATLDLLEKRGIEFLFLVPTMLNALIHDPTVHGRDWSRLKVMQIGSAPITDTTALKAREIFGHKLWQGYGQTECVPVAMMGPDEWFAKLEGSEPLRACGKPLPFAGLEIWDADNRPVATGAVGQIVARCEGQMVGFWDNPAATAERIIDGWVLSGDIGRIDHNGYVYILDRANDMIVSGGYNIYPTEVENILAQHPAVIEVAVIGVPHPRWGETPMAVCYVSDTAAVSEDELIEACARELGSYKKPSRIEFRTAPLPKSPVGKILRKDLREQHWAGHDRRIAGA